MGGVEGLLLWHALKALPPPPLPTRGWVFPDEKTAALRVPGGYLVLGYRPDRPFLAFEEEVAGGAPLTPFQRTLVEKARGELLLYLQPGLDRVAVLYFAGERGFVSTPPVRLVLEATGRNANLLLLDQAGRILALDRPIPKEKNRYRELLPGKPYTPPPPYAKLDPRALAEDDLKTLLGRPPRELARRVDGLSPRFAEALARAAGLDPQAPLDEAGLRALEEVLERAVQDPAFAFSLAGELRPAPEASEEALKRPILEALEKERKRLLARLEDHRKNLARAERARARRHLGELVLAYAHEIPKGAPSAELFDYERGEPVTVPLDPERTPVENARAYFEAAKKDEEAARRAEKLLALTEKNLQALEKELAEVQRLSYKELKKRLARRKEEGPKIGLRYRAPGGFLVFVGRNARENAALLELARSEDLWFHAQGVPGSHVILRTGGKPPPLEALLFAARLAAYHSRARGERSAPVDYTRRKYVRKVKKAPPGTVTYTQAKTLFVDASLPENLDAV